MENERKRQHEKSLSEAAKDFLIDNHAEASYLPLCVMAASKNKYVKHNRNIYNQFNKCANEIQKEILRQENIPISVLNNVDWDDYLRQLEKKAEEFKLGRSLLYDNAKHFHGGFKHSSERTKNYPEHIFVVPSLNKNIDPNKSSLTLYIDRYLEFVLKDRDDTRNKPELLPQTPPFDLLWVSQQLGSCPSSLICFWAMKAVYSTCIAFHRHGIVGGDKSGLDKYCC